MDRRLGRGRVPRHRSAAALSALLAWWSSASAQPAALPGLPDPDPPGTERVTRYLEAVDRALPLSPAQILDFNARVREGRAAANWRPFPAATVTDTDLVTLEPGQTPPAVRLSPGVASVVTFSDATGQAWPVAGWTVGDRGGFDIRHPGGVDGMQGPSHLTMAPLVEAGWTNLVVELAGEPIPVILSLIVDQARPHYRLDVQVLAMGPFAAPAAALAGAVPAAAGDADLLRFAAAVDLPPGAVETQVENVAGVRVWFIGPRPGSDAPGEMIVRTPHMLLGPGWSDALTAAGGIRVYRLAAANALLFSVNGGAVIARVARP